MKKVILFSITAIMLLGALTGCSGKGNVSDDKDGKITEPSSLLEEATDMISEIMTTEPTTERNTTEDTTNDAVGGESEPSESTDEETQNNGRARRIMPR